MSFTHYRVWRPQGDSNPCYSRERAVSWASRRWGLCYCCSLLSIRQSVWTLRGKVSSGKEVIQPQVPLRLPCYDFTPVMNHKVVSALPKVKLPTSFATHSHGVTGGVYKARERIHRGILIHDY
jgi:hypothetical protein